MYPFGYSADTKAMLKSWAAQLKAFSNDYATNAANKKKDETIDGKWTFSNGLYVPRGAYSTDTWSESAEAPSKGDIYNKIEAILSELSIIEGLLNGNQIVRGQYTPTLYNTTNISASTHYPSEYVIIGDWISVFGKVDIDAIAAGNTVLGIQYPVISGLTQVYQVAGTGSNDVNAQSGVIYADAANDRAIFRYQATVTANTGFYYHFSGLIL